MTSERDMPVVILASQSQTIQHRVYSLLVVIDKDYLVGCDCDLVAGILKLDSR
jgi:hypothetical protein